MLVGRALSAIEAPRPSPMGSRDSRGRPERVGAGWGKSRPRQGGAPGLTPPPPAARGRRRPRSALSGWSRRLTSAGPAEAAGHKGSFVRRRRLRGHPETELLGQGAGRGRRRGGGEGGRVEPQPRDPAPAHLPVPRTFGPGHWQEMRGCCHPVGRTSAPPRPGPHPCLRGPTTRRTGSRAQPRSPRLLSEAQAWTPLSRRCASRSIRALMPAQQEAGGRWFLPSVLRGNPAQRDH